LQQAKTHCNTLQHTATQRTRVDDTKEKKRRGIMAQTRCAEPCVACGSLMARGILPLCLLTDYYSLQHTTTRRKTLQQTATHTSCDKGYFKRTATHCNPSPPAALASEKSLPSNQKINHGLGKQEAKRHTKYTKSRVLRAGPICCGYTP